MKNSRTFFIQLVNNLPLQIFCKWGWMPCRYPPENGYIYLSIFQKTKLHIQQVHLLFSTIQFNLCRYYTVTYETENSKLK